MSAITTDGLRKYYGDVRGIDDLSLSVETGEVFGFLGPNGAGKTTTIRTLLGFQSPTGGEGSLLGASITDRRALRTVRHRVGYLPGDPAFDENRTGRELIDHLGRLQGDERSAALLDLFDPPVDRRIRGYSRGNRQKLAIVLAFMHAPELVVMDEPTSGLDPLLQQRFYEFLREENADGVTVFFSSHVLSEVRAVCDRVGVIREGHLVAVESVDELLARSGKRVHADVAGTVDHEAFAFEGVHDLQVEGTVSFTYTGDYDTLLDRLSRHHLRDLTIEEAPLEEVFMRFYGEADVTDDEPAAPEVD